MSLPKKAELTFENDLRKVVNHYSVGEKYDVPGFVVADAICLLMTLPAFTVAVTTLNNARLEDEARERDALQGELPFDAEVQA